MTRGRWIIAVIVAIEAIDLGLLLTHPAVAKALMRTIYDYGMSVVPKPEGYKPTHRFR